MTAVYDYANARIRGLRSRLLRPAELEALGGRVDLGELVAGLARSDYAPDLEQARQRLGGLPLIEEALRRNLCRRLGALRDFFAPPPGAPPGEGRRLVGIILARYDLANLVAVLRGKLAGAPAAQVAASLMPAGDLDAPALEALAETPDPAAYLAQIRRRRLPYLAPLAAAVAAAPADGALPPLELVLRRGFLNWAMRELRGGGTNVAGVREALALEVDAANLTTALRLVQGGVPRAADPAAWLLPGGRMPAGELAALLDRPTVADAVATLGRAPWKRALAGAIAERLALTEGVALETAVERYLAAWARSQVYRDPLGIALALAYEASKAEEVRTLRLIARGIAGRWPRERVRQLIGVAGR
jgi:V/A-type H+-transporting ATPase subunit C